MEEVVIIDALRSPFGSYQGAFKHISAVDLGVTVTKKLVETYPQLKEKIDSVIFGTVLQAGLGQNAARQVALKSGLSQKIRAYTVNQVCGSSLKSAMLGYEEILLGKSQLVLVGGIENMSQAPKLYYKDGREVASLFHDGLTDAFSEELMGMTAEKVAEMYQISKAEQDEYAYASYKKASKALENGKFQKEVLPFPELKVDEGLLKKVTLKEKQAKNSVFKEKGTVTAGNASTLNDGASVLLLASKSFALQEKLPILATIKDMAEVGIDPSLMGLAPVSAIETLLKKNNLALEEIDLFEINEAFAATSLAVEKLLKLPRKKVNPYGGALALGHALGASGGRILGSLAHQLQQEEKRLGVASLCIGGGLGIAVLVERDTPVQATKKFRNLTVSERLSWIKAHTSLTQASYEFLSKPSLKVSLVNNMIENAIGEVAIPLGIVRDVNLDGKIYQVPLSTEEPSVLAACNYSMKLIPEFKVVSHKHLLRGQIVFENITKPYVLLQQLKALEEKLYEIAEKTYPSIVKRGGGLKKISYRLLEAGFFSLDILVDVKDAFGANMVNSILEGIGNYLKEVLPQYAILMMILCNDGEESFYEVTCEIPLKNIGGKSVGEKIQQASLLAKVDPYRRVTHNKGILNGIAGVALATGNDTRQVAASLYHYGSQHPLTTFTVDNQYLYGNIKIPLNIAAVGGATRQLPASQAAFEILGITKSEVLGNIMAAIGLAQNLAALKALVTEGIQKGHMQLHFKTMFTQLGATEKQLPQLVKALQQEKVQNREVAKMLLETLNEKNEL